MDLDTYDHWGQAEVGWLIGRLRKEGVEALARTFAALGEAGILRFRDDNHADIAEYLTTQRNRRGPIERRFAAGRDRQAFLIAAAYTARCGAALLQYSCTYGFSAGTRASHAFLLQQASAVARNLQQNFPTVWPFVDEHDPANDD